MCVYVKASPTCESYFACDVRGASLNSYHTSCCPGLLGLKKGLLVGTVLQASGQHSYVKICGVWWLISEVSPIEAAFDSSKTDDRFVSSCTASI